MKIVSISFTLITFYMIFITYSIYHADEKEAEIARDKIEEQTYSPDGKYLVLKNTHGLKIIEIETGKTTDLELELTSLSISPDSKHLSLIEKGNRVKVIRLGSNQVIKAY